MSNWQPVSVALPDLDKVVLVAFSSGYDGKPVIAFGAREDDGDYWYWGVGGKWGVRLDHDAGWNGIAADDDYQVVTHWAELQNPPSSGEDQKR